MEKASWAFTFTIHGVFKGPHTPFIIHCQLESVCPCVLVSPGKWPAASTSAILKPAARNRASCKRVRGACNLVDHAEGLKVDGLYRAKRRVAEHADARKSGAWRAGPHREQRDRTKRDVKARW